MKLSAAKASVNDTMPRGNQEYIMAKANSKTKPTHAETFAAVVTATQTALLQFAKGKVAAAVEGMTRSAAAVAAIVTLRTEAKDIAEFNAAAVSLLGNRDKTKAGRIVGTLRPLLESAKIDDAVIRNLIKEMRTLADYIDDADIRAIGLKSGSQAAYNAVLAAKKKQEEAKAPSTPAAAPPKLLTFDEMLAAKLEADADSVLARIESWFTAHKEPIKASTVHTARMTLAG